MKTLILAIALGGTALAGAAGAQTMPTAPATPSDSTAPRGHHGHHMRGMGGLMMSDANGDGVVTREDVIADADRRFAAMDANHDGKLTGDERRAYHDAQRAERMARRQVDAGQPAAQPAPPPGPDNGRMAGRKDRTITQAEFRDRALKMFDRVDTNHDGRIDASERDAFRLMMRARMADRHAAPPPATAPETK